MAVNLDVIVPDGVARPGMGVAETSAGKRADKTKAKQMIQEKRERREQIQRWGDETYDTSS